MIQPGGMSPFASSPLPVAELGIRWNSFHLFRRFILAIPESIRSDTRIAKPPRCGRNIPRMRVFLSGLRAYCKLKTVNPPTTSGPTQPPRRYSFPDPPSMVLAPVPTPRPTTMTKSSPAPASMELLNRFESLWQFAHVEVVEPTNNLRNANFGNG